MKTLFRWTPSMLLFWFGGLIQGLAIASHESNWIVPASLFATMCFTFAGIITPNGVDRS